MSAHEPDPATDHEDERVRERAQLLPEEQAAGSSDPEQQAHSILQESDERAAQAETEADTGAEPIERQNNTGPL
ncbi:hypothetical protein IQ251_05335 [Saccharopolyspora sp. HNM0983]|uniref:Uncharacterized protein n=1 Tax=Saccharopolyspora montiporae TaxID=2781240 RepID=A0A929FYZ7_9PSEU|nr:hypothetical protein [Saccharopolyspora sp. HNM0983]MBE9373869.1 hypothetical protein [Saccharopolyspora sp. HNM0983]